MVRRFLERLGAPVRGLHQAAYVLAALTLASQVLALLRDRTFAASFGAGHTLDLYYAAFKVPDLVFALIASLVSAYVLIPRLAGASAEESRELLSQSVSFLLIAGGAIALVLAIFASPLLALLYPSFTANADWPSFVLLSQVLLLQPIILGISGVVTSVSQVHRRFTLFALSPVLYNLGIIFGVLALYPTFGILGIGYGVLIGALLHVGIHLPIVSAAGAFPRIELPRWSKLAPIIRDSVPRSLALAMGSVTALVLTSLASRLSEGAISVFTLAGNLEAVPLSLVGASYAVAAFPALSEASKTDKEEFGRILSASARHIILWSMIFLGLTAVLRAHIVRTILGSGAFDWDATRLTAALLAILAAGLVAQGLVLLFSRALYAAHQSWRPLLYQLAGGVATVVLAVALLSLPVGNSLLEGLSSILRVGDVAGTKILFIALAATLGQVLLAVWSLVALRSSAPLLARALARPLFGGLFAAIVGGAAAYAVLYIGGDIAPLTTLAAVFTQGLVAGMVGLVASGLALYAVGNQEFKDILGALGRLAVSLRAHVPILGPSAPEEPIRE